MSPLTRALAPAAVLLTLLAAGCANSGSGSTATTAPATPAAPATTTATPAATTTATPAVTTSAATPATSSPAAATTPAASGSATPPAQGAPAGTAVYYAQALDVNQAVQRPGCDTEIGCPVSGDGTTQLSDMTWTTWNVTTAVGTGTEKIDDCKPTCVNGHGYSVKVIVTFSHPAKDCADGDKWFWTQAYFNWPNGLPSALSGDSAPKNPFDVAPFNMQSCA